MTAQDKVNAAARETQAQGMEKSIGYGQQSHSQSVEVRGALREVTTMEAK